MAERSKVRYSRTGAYQKGLRAIFSQFLDKRRVETACRVFFASCALELTQDNMFTIQDVMNHPEISNEHYPYDKVKRTIYDMEKIGIFECSSKRIKPRFFSLTIQECASGLVKQSKEVKRMYKRIKFDLKDARR